LNSPAGITVDAAETLYIADFFNHRIRRVALDGAITTIAGNGLPGAGPDNLNNPIDVALDRAGNLYISDLINRAVRRRTPAGVMTTVAQTPAFYPGGIAVDEAGTVLVSSAGANRILRIAPDGNLAPVAGSAAAGFSGDGGAATAALLAAPEDVAADRFGAFYIADTRNLRVRRVGPEGLISTIAGNGALLLPTNQHISSRLLFQPIGLAIDGQGSIYVANQARDNVVKYLTDGRVVLVAGNGIQGFSGDGGPARQARLSGPRGVAVDSRGNVYIGDNGNSRVRKVTPDGIISTFAGGGTSLSNGIPAIQAAFFTLPAVAVGPGDIVYVTDWGSNRIRSIDGAGIIRTIAGNGQNGFSGDGGPGTQATLNLIGAAILADPAGNVYFADFPRVRRVRPDGRIDTFAGGGTQFGEGIPATSALIRDPRGLAVDPTGNVYIADADANKIYRVAGDGRMFSFVGTGVAGYTGDGDLATLARITYPEGAVGAPNGDVYFSDTLNNRIRVVLAAPPPVTVTPRTLDFTAVSGDAPSASPAVFLTSPVDGIRFGASISGDRGGDWIQINRQAGDTPGSIQVTVNPSNLPAGVYRGVVTLATPNALPVSSTVAITATINAPGPPKLQLSLDRLRFDFVPGSPAQQSGQVSVRNTGGGSLAFNVTVETLSGGAWLRAAPQTGSVTRLSPSSIAITADRTGLREGTYSGVITVAGGSDRVIVNVTAVVTGDRPKILLSQTGLSFVAVAEGGAVPSQTFGVLNDGFGVLNWSARATTFSMGDWLRATPAQGSSASESLTVPLVEVLVDAARLPAGVYHGEVEVRSAEASNMIQTVAVNLTVLQRGSDPGPVVRPSGLIFISRQNAPREPEAQFIQISNLTRDSLNFNSGQSAFEGINLVSIQPPFGTVLSDRPAGLVVQPKLAGLAPRVRYADIVLSFLQGSRVIRVLTLVLPGIGGIQAGVRQSQHECKRESLLPVFKSLGVNFPTPLGLPAPVEVEVTDNCGNWFVDTRGSVVASFSNGDAPIALINLKNGRWSGTWQPRQPSAVPVTVTVTAEVPGQPISGRVTIMVGLQPSGDDGPIVGLGAIVNSASLVPGLPLAPGTIVSIFGDRLSSRDETAGQAPFPTQLGGTRVTLAGVAMPLTYSSGTQVNAILPFGLTIDTTHQLIVRRGNLQSVPQGVDLAEAQPGIFTNDFSGSGPAIAFDANGRYINASNPASKGLVIVLYASGLGEVDPTLEAGQPAPVVPPLSIVKRPVKVTIGGVEAQVLFAGMAPGFAGVYQLNVEVPDAPLGNPPLVVEAAGIRSRGNVTIAVR